MAAFGMALFEKLSNVYEECWIALVSVTVRVILTVVHDV